MIQRTTWATSIAKTNLVLASNSRNLNLLLGLLGAGALATGAVATGKYLTRKDPKSDMGKIKLKLPGSKKDPNTAAEVELPIDMPGMSPTLIEGLNRGVRLQARKNVRANSFKRDPETGKLVPYEEWKAQQTAKAQQSDNVVEFPALTKAASTSPGLANLLAKALGAGVGGTVGALGGGAALASPMVAVNKVKQFNQQEVQQRREAQQYLSSYRTANAQPKIQGAPSPQPLARSSGGLVWGTQQPWNKTASMPPQQPPKMPPNQLARRPVGPTLPPSPGIAPAAAKAGAPPTGGVETIANKVQGAANEALDMQAKQAYVVDYIAFISFLLPERC